MLLKCNNKDCRRLAEVKLDPETNEVICCDCGEVIKDVTEFVKVTLRSNKQFVKRAKGNSNFNVECSSCKKKVCPIPKDKSFICPECFAQIKLSKAFENVLRSSIKSK